MPEAASRSALIKNTDQEEMSGSVSIRSKRVLALVVALGLIITLTVFWAAWTLNRNSEHHLLEVQTRQAGDVLASTILSLENPLVTAARVAAATGGNEQQFDRSMASAVGPDRQFVFASLWITGPEPRSATSIGTPTAPGATAAVAPLAVKRALQTGSIVVTGITHGQLVGISYVVPDSKNGRYVVFAERAIPVDRRVPVESNLAFSDINYATYLGRVVSSADLATTDLPSDHLPITGNRVQESIPFGSTVLTLVISPAGQLGGALGEELPWFLLLGGVLVTVATALAADQLVKRRRAAELDSLTIAGLYEQMDHLYGEQRTIADTLQRALLPQRNPSIPMMQVASRYVAGADRVDIGGDWYSMVRIDDQHFAFVVGDVSGHGIGAATVMARMRFTLRAYLVEGHSPDTALEMSSRQLDVNEDGHMATVLVGFGEISERRVTLANAGHPTPLLLSAAGAEFIDTPVGLPLGLGASTYSSTTVVMPPGSTLLAFTDGLVERRGELIDVGMERLARSASSPEAPLEEVVTRVITELALPGAGDDIAILAFRWTDDPASTDQVGPTDQSDQSDQEASSLTMRTAAARDAAEE